MDKDTNIYIMSHECRDIIIKEIEYLVDMLGLLDENEEFDYNDLYYGMDDVDLVGMLMKLQIESGRESVYGLELEEGE